MTATHVKPGTTAGASRHTPASPFTLARMRHLDLLALYYQLHNYGYGDWHDLDRAARMSKEHLASAVLAEAART